MEGQFIQNTDSLYRTEIISFNPTTEAEIGRVECIDRQGIDSAVKQANQAFTAWSKTSLTERLNYLNKLSRAIFEQAEDIARLIALEQGKTLTEAKLHEIVSVLAIIKSIRRNAKKNLRTRAVKNEMILFTHKKCYYRFEPYGVVAIITPWNYPFSVPIPEIVAAAIAGNTVIFKPAPGTVLIGQKIDELFKAAGFPAGVINTVFIQDVDAPYLVGHENVNKIVFTGSTETGKNVMQTAATQISSVLLELGGKDPAIIAADANIERAAKGVVWGAFFNAGQVCASIERVYVEQSVSEKFISSCVKLTQTLRIGNPLEKNTDMGPLENKRQLEKVKAMVDEAVQKGAKVLCGGKRFGDRGFFYEPTILTNVDHSMNVMTEETFGPVLPIMVVNSIDEAIRLANDSKFGLSAYGWTSNRETADRLQSELIAGTVMINDATSSWGEPKAPWGGFKKSGIGRTRAEFGLMEMVQVKYTSYDKGKNRFNLWWFPNDSAAEKIADDAIRLLFSPKWVKRIIPLLRAIITKRFYQTVDWFAIFKNLKKLY